MALVVATALAASLLLDPNDLKPRLVEAVEARTGRALTVDGDVSLHLLPRPGAELSGLALAHASGDGHFAELDDLRVDVALLPLLAGRIVIDSLRVEGLRVELGRDAAGRVNWADLAQALAGRSSAAGAAAIVPPLGGIEVRDATLRFDDRAAGEHVVARDVSVDIGALRIGEPVQVDAHFRIEDRRRGLAGDSRLAATLHLARDLAAIDASPITLDGTLRGERLPGGSLALAVRGDARLDLRSRRLTSDAIDVDIETGGALDTTLHGALDVDLSAGILDKTTLLMNANMNGLAGFDGTLEARGTLGGDLTRGEYTWTGVEGRGALTRAGDAAERLPVRIGADVRLRAGEGELAISDLRLAIADTRVRAELAFDGRRLSLSPLTLEVDGAHVTGELAATATGEQATRIDLRASDVRVDRLLAALGVPSGGLALDGASGIDLTATLDVDAQARRVRIDALALDARLADATFPGGVLALGARGGAEVDLAAATLRARELAFTLGGATVLVDLDAAGLGGKPRIDAVVHAPSFAPRPFAAALGRALPATADPSALAHVGFAAKVRADAGTVEVWDFRAILDDSLLEGAATFSANARPRLSFHLELDYLELDRYLSPAEGDAHAGLPVAALAQADAGGELRIGTLVVDDVTLHDIRLAAGS